MRHRVHQVQETSLMAFIAEKESGRLGERAKACAIYISRHPYVTACEVMAGLGFADPNKVRPRISELKKEGVIVEDGVKECPISHKYEECYRLVPGKAGLIVGHEEDS